MAPNGDRSASNEAVSGYNVFVLALFLALVLTSTTPGNAPRRSNGTPEASSSRATGSSTDVSSSTQADIMFPTHPDPTLPEKDRKRWKKLFFELSTIETHRANPPNASEEQETAAWNRDIANTTREGHKFAKYRKNCLRSRETNIREILRKMMVSVGDTRGGGKKKTEVKKGGGASAAPKEGGGKKRKRANDDEGKKDNDEGYREREGDKEGEGNKDSEGNNGEANEDNAENEGNTEDEDNAEDDPNLSTVANGKRPTHGPKKPRGGGRGGRGHRDYGDPPPGAGMMS